MCYSAGVIRGKIKFIMNAIYAIIIVVIIGLGGWYFLGSSSSGDSTGDQMDKEKDELTLGEERDKEVAGKTEAEIAADASMEIGSNVSFGVKGVPFSFDVKEIRVKKGDTVTVNFESSEGLHDWVVDEFSASTAQVQPGTPTSVTFVADTAGTFEYYCSVGNHRGMGMVGTLIVE